MSAASPFERPLEFHFPSGIPGSSRPLPAVTAVPQSRSVNGPAVGSIVNLLQSTEEGAEGWMTAQQTPSKRLLTTWRP